MKKLIVIKKNIPLNFKKNLNNVSFYYFFSQYIGTIFERIPTFVAVLKSYHLTKHQIPRAKFDAHGTFLTGVNN